MSMILNIDTSGETAGICLAENGIVIHKISNDNQKDHAAFLHNAIKNLLEITNVEIKSLAAIAVTIGPGSYTGLRVGMATAKGLCYALSKPFITLVTLHVMAKAAIEIINKQDISVLYCPLIDARRMEVYAAIFDKSMNEILSPTAIILNENSFNDLLKKNSLFFFGNGAIKFETLVQDKNASFITLEEFMPSLSQLSFKKYSNHDFTELAHSEPFYIKEFHSY